MLQHKTSLFLGTVLLVFASCKKPDTTPPVITLNGGNVTLFIGGTYTDQGAVAQDDRNGDLTDQMEVTNPVNPALAGTYNVHYSVSDFAGNEGTADRTVIVKNTAAAFKGKYSVKDSIWGGTVTNYFDTINVSSTTNDRLFVNRFGNHIYGTVYFDLVSTQTAVSVPSQNVNCGSPLSVRTFSTPANGTVSGAPYTIIFDYQEISGTTTTMARATYIQQ